MSSLRIDPPKCRCTDCLTGYSRPATADEWVCSSGLLSRRECAEPWACEHHSGRAAERAGLADLLADMASFNGDVTEAEVVAAMRAWRIAESGGLA